MDFDTWDLKCFSNPSFQLRSYLLSMCYQNGEVWAGDNKGTIHAFSVRSGVLKPLSRFDVGHTSLVTGIHKSPGSLYTSSSDRTLKVGLGVNLTQQIFLQLTTCTFLGISTYNCRGTYFKGTVWESSFL